MEHRIRFLFRQYLENKCTRREFDELFALLRDADHDQELRQLVSEAYTALGQTSVTYVDETGNLVLPEPEWLTQPEDEKPVKKKRSYAALVITAGIAATVGGVYLMNKKEAAPKPAMSVSSTERSEYRFLLLPDSTEVWLNAASTLEYPADFGKSNRNVYLSGEAYFDVKHQAQQPFIIHTGKIATTVLGTAFNIKAYADLSNVTVAVSRGKVKVQYLDKEVATLTTGQQVRVNNNGSGIADKRSGLQQVAAWQQGKLAYDDEPVSEIVADLERVYNVSIDVTNDTVSNMRISTSFNRQTGVEKALEILCRLTDAALKQEGGKYYVH
ncbi:DUF4974 domain-containing protein [Pseudoflavitalea sp. G-6-1-2]|uniref:FecR family protein n=1 Tax=Pseudoflavitalea sp. G-6-1-2 TaxID=2728841 RepID=UPI00146B8539|nr:FecR domain-containing protein [Pseudoflavitalea sp. G-6-1-2]NML19738.1 DUF4974 domain-containing protein [Pseudoflavitalea sp. G-6-1-2]